MSRAWRPLGKGLLFRIIALGLGLLLTVAVDRVVGLVSSASVDDAGLISRPYAQTRYDTMEFDVTATSNNIGIRDRQVHPKPPGTFRIVALGDSFTFGWGVGLEETWVKLLESQLRSQLREDIEVVNLGIPGGYPSWYHGIFDRSISILDPDMVIVAVLQADDVNQQMHTKSSVTYDLFRSCTPVRHFADVLLPRLWPNFLRLSELARPAGTMLVSDPWKSHAEWILCLSDDGMKQRFRRIPEPLQAAFLTGKLDPYLVSRAIARPDYFSLALELDDEGIQQGVDRMAGDLTRIKVTADRQPVPVITMSVPSPVYVSELDQQGQRELGFIVTSEMLTDRCARRGHSAGDGAGRTAI